MKIWCAIALAALAAIGQDAITLKNGKRIPGKIIETTEDGFRFLTDDDRLMYIRNSQVLDTKEPEPPEGMLRGEHFVCSGGVLDGLPTYEDENEVLLWAAGEQIRIKKENIRLREKRIVSESAVFSALQIFDRKQAGLDMTTFDRVKNVAAFGLKNRLFDSVLKLYASAGEKDGAHTEDYKTLTAECLAQQTYQAALDQVEAANFDKAIELAETLIGDYAETPTALQNPNLRQQIESQRQAFFQKRKEFLAKVVVKKYRALVEKRVRELAAYQDLETAIKDSWNIDYDVTNKLAGEFRCADRDILCAFKAAARTKTSSSFGCGTWVLLSLRENIALSSLLEEIPNDIVETGGSAQKPENQKPIIRKRTGSVDGQFRNLRNAFWMNSNVIARRLWLEAYYAYRSDIVEKNVYGMDCHRCAGAGEIAFFSIGFGDDKSPQQGTKTCEHCYGTRQEWVIRYK